MQITLVIIPYISCQLSNWQVTDLPIYLYILYK
uniref:Uncharacterized protein n=1 Tax=Dulem virus 41 TaxID=3145759 RepID=A0AAU8AY00_9CAUD